MTATTVGGSDTEGARVLRRPRFTVEELDRRRGHRPDFLGVDLPELPLQPAREHEIWLHYTHFSVLLDRLRRLPRLTIVDIDGARWKHIPRAQGDVWSPDPRVEPNEQRVVAAFDGGEGTTDAGGLLLGATDRTIHLVGRFAACFVDHRALAQVEHTVAAMVAQRVFGIVLGYEDLIDHDQVRHAPVLAVLAGKLEAKRQNGAPLDASTGAKDQLARIVGQIRARWPRAKVLLRGDSGFARDELMTWCETNGVDYVFGLARNERLVGAIADDLATAALAS